MNWKSISLSWASPSSFVVVDSWSLEESLVARSLRSGGGGATVLGLQKLRTYGLWSNWSREQRIVTMPLAYNRDYRRTGKEVGRQSERK